MGNNRKTEDESRKQTNKGFVIWKEAKERNKQNSTHRRQTKKKYSFSHRPRFGTLLLLALLFYIAIPAKGFIFFNVFFSNLCFMRGVVVES